eukprot:m.425628 g.425628  ORF g.425628 m.425628 type:complete len:54 (+) comp53439_c0_seq1:133-294(+)
MRSVTQHTSMEFVGAACTQNSSRPHRAGSAQKDLNSEAKLGVVVLFHSLRLVE